MFELAIGDKIRTDLTLRKAVASGLRVIRQDNTSISICSDEHGICSGMELWGGEGPEINIFHRIHGSSRVGFPQYKIPDLDLANFVETQVRGEPFSEAQLEIFDKVETENRLTTRQLEMIAKVVISFGHKVHIEGKQSTRGIISPRLIR